MRAGEGNVTIEVRLEEEGKSGQIIIRGTYDRAARIERIRPESVAESS